MPQQNQRAELHATIWGIANDLRGAIGGWDFKAYVLSSLFYRFIFENTTAYFNRMLKAVGSDKSYADMSDNEAENARTQAIDEKGFFILPSQLFSNVAKSLDTNKEDTYKNLNERISTIFHEIEKSALGTPSEDDLKGLFTDFVVSWSASPLRSKTLLSQNWSSEFTGTYTQRMVLPSYSASSKLRNIDGRILLGLLSELMKSFLICSTASGSTPVTVPSSLTPSNMNPP